MITAAASTSNTNSTTGSGFAALTIVTTACHGVLNTVFIAPSPKPAWFDGLSAKLDTAKVLAHEWINDMAPKMTASIPGHVIDYATTYRAMSDQIVDLLNKNPTAKGKDDPVVQEVFALIQVLQDELARIIGEVQETQDQLKVWGDRMQKAHDDLYAGAADIQKLQSELTAEIEQMNSAIKGLRDLIDSENRTIAAAGIAVGVGLFALVAGLALAPVTGGASLIVSGLGLVTIIGGSVTWGVMQSRVNHQFSEIAKDQQHIDEDKRQLVALQGLSLAANSAISSIATATQSLSDVKVMWGVFQGELQGTLYKLNHTDEELSAIVNKAGVIGAQSEWDLAVEFAQQLVGMKVGTEARTLPMAA